MHAETHWMVSLGKGEERLQRNCCNGGGGRPVMATASTATAAAAENPQYFDKHITQRPSPPRGGREGHTQFSEPTVVRP